VRITYKDVASDLATITDSSLKFITMRLLFEDRNNYKLELLFEISILLLRTLLTPGFILIRGSAVCDVTDDRLFI